MTDVDGNPSGPLTESTAVDALLSIASKAQAPEEHTTENESHQTEEVDETPSETEPEEQDDQPSEDVESSDDEEDTDEPTPAPRKLKVKIDGKEEWVNEEEAANGYSRTKDYTQKTQALSEQRKAFEAEATAVRQERQRYATDLGTIETILKEVHGAEPDWATLQMGDPAEYAAAHATWQIKQQQQSQVRQLKAEAELKIAQDSVRLHNERINAEAAKLPELIPEWKKADVMKKELPKTIEYAKSLGYSDSDIANVADARVFVMLRKAMLQDAAQSAKPTVQNKIEAVRVRTAAPGSPTASSPKAEKDLNSALARVAKSGKPDDAAAAILNIGIAAAKRRR